MPMTLLHLGKTVRVDLGLRVDTVVEGLHRIVIHVVHRLCLHERRLTPVCRTHRQQHGTLGLGVPTPIASADSAWP